MKYITPFILSFGLFCITPDLAFASEKELAYKAAIRCSAILGIKATEDNENASEITQEHLNEAGVWLKLAFKIYHGDKEQFGSAVEMIVISTYEAVSEGSDRNDVLIAKLAQCDELRSFHAQAFDEFHSMVDEVEEVGAAEAAVDAVE